MIHSIWYCSCLLLNTHLMILVWCLKPGLELLKSDIPEASAQPHRWFFRPVVQCQAAVSFKGAECVFLRNDRPQHFCVSGLSFSLHPCTEWGWCHSRLVCELAGEHPLCLGRKRHPVLLLKSFSGHVALEWCCFSELAFVGFVLKSFQRMGMPAERAALVFCL